MKALVFILGRKKHRRIAAALVALLVAGGGAALATIPSGGTGGTINACYAKRTATCA